MPLVIEDGTAKSDATSYGVTDETTTLAAARAYASDRGIALPADDAALAVLLVKATDYIESKAMLFVGKPTSTTQALSWPRKWIRADVNLWFPSDELPPALLKALYQLCIEQQNGITLMPSHDPNSDGHFVVREKVDVLETQYSERIGTTNAPMMPVVDSLLAGLLYTSGPFALRNIRV